MEEQISNVIWWERQASFKDSPPPIFAQSIDLHKNFVIINEISKIPKEKRRNYILLFYSDEKFFNAYYTRLQSNPRYLATLEGFYAVSGLDFSTYPNIDESVNIESIKKNCRFCTYCQKNDILCIYNAVWTSQKTFHVAFDNIQADATIILSTYRIKSDHDEVFETGYEYLKTRCKPKTIICYGKPQLCMREDLKTNLVHLIPTRFKLMKAEMLERTIPCLF